MTKVMNAIFGIAIAIIVYIVLLLGIQTFYPEPEYEDYCNETTDFVRPIGLMDCEDNLTVGECKTIVKEQEINEKESCWDPYDKARDKYEKNLFLIAMIIGLIVIIIALFVLSMTNISAGLIMASVVLIVYGFARGWRAADDRLKFVFALIDAAVIISFAIMLNKKKK